MTGAAHRACDSASQPAPDVVILSPFVSDDETAAIVAVVGAALANEAFEARRSAPPANAWVRGRRGLRGPLEVGKTKWQGFSG